MFLIHIIKICYARILIVRKHISVIMNILVQSVFGRFSKHFYRNMARISLQLDLTSEEDF